MMPPTEILLEAARYHEILNKILARTDPCTYSSLTKETGIGETTLRNYIKAMTDAGLVQELNTKNVGAPRYHIIITPLGSFTAEYINYYKKIMDPSEPGKKLIENLEQILTNLNNNQDESVRKYYKERFRELCGSNSEALSYPGLRNFFKVYLDGSECDGKIIDAFRLCIYSIVNNFDLMEWFRSEILQIITDQSADANLPDTIRLSRLALLCEMRDQSKRPCISSPIGSNELKTDILYEFESLRRTILETLLNVLKKENTESEVFIYIFTYLRGLRLNESEGDDVITRMNALKFDKSIYRIILE